jgi:transposase-like protein
MAKKHRDRGKEQYWRDVLRRQARSRSSVAEFCRREGLSQPSFYAWRRIVSQRDGRRAKQADSGARAVGFLPVRLREVAPRVEAPITIELNEGLVLRLPESIAVQRLAELVHALEARREP